MRLTIGSTTTALFAYNCVGSSYEGLFVPIELGTRVWLSYAGTPSGYGLTLRYRGSTVVRRDSVVTSTLAFELAEMQLQTRGSWFRGGANTEPSYHSYTGSTFWVSCVGSINAPDLLPQFEEVLFWGLSGSNYYTRFAGFGNIYIPHRKEEEEGLVGTLDVKSIPVNGSIATLVWRGTNNSGMVLSPRRFTMLGSFTGTAGAGATIAIITQEACERAGGHINKWTGDWGEIGDGTVWAATFYVCPTFATFQYRREQVTIDEAEV